MAQHTDKDNGGDGMRHANYWATIYKLKYLVLNNLKFIYVKALVNIIKAIGKGENDETRDGIRRAWLANSFSMLKNVTWLKFVIPTRLKDINNPL